MSFKPSRSATIAYEDERIRVFTDGTWVGLQKGQWVILPHSVVYATGTGDANLQTSWGHQKASHVEAPDGTKYDVRGLA